MVALNGGSVGGTEKGTAASSLRGGGAGRRPGWILLVMVLGFWGFFFPLCSGRYFLSVGRLIQDTQQPVYGGGSLRLSTGRSISLMLSCAVAVCSWAGKVTLNIGKQKENPF